MKKERVLIGLTYYYPNISGLSNYVKILANHINKKFKVTILTSHFDKKLQCTDKIDHVKIIRVGGFNLGKGFIMPGYFFKSFVEVSKNQIINIHLPSVESFWLALWAKLFKKKIIVTYHCYFETNNKFFEKLVNLIHIIILIFADKIIVNSYDYINGNNLLNDFENKIVEIFPPILVKKPSEKELEEVENKLKPFEGKKIIGFLGRISKEKSIETLLRAIPLLENKIKNFLIVIAGSENVIGEKKYKIEIENLIKKYKKRIIKIGEIKNPAAFYLKCDCLVLPSVGKLESFGMVQAEASLCETPIICSNLPGIRIPVLLSKNGELFEAGNTKDLSNKIVKVLNNTKKIRINEKIKNNFNFLQTVNKYEKIFRENKI